jgi:PAS domain S-box-containing protein
MPMTMSRILDDRGRVIGLSTSSRDITEAKRAEVRLRQLSRAVEQGPGMVMITDPSGVIEYVNPKVLEVTGYASDEMIGQNPRLLKSGERSTEDYAELWRTISAGKQWHGDFRNQRKDGSRYWVSASISPIKGDDGRITHYVAVQEDISVRKQAEQVLRDSERELRLVADAMPGLIAYLDTSLCPIGASSGRAGLSGAARSAGLVAGPDGAARIRTGAVTHCRRRRGQPVGLSTTGGRQEYRTAAGRCGGCRRDGGSEDGRYDFPQSDQQRAQIHP